MDSAWGLNPPYRTVYGVLEKSQIPSTKLQTNLKFQYSMTKTGLEFVILVIVICLIFVICDLEFLVTPANVRLKERRQKPPMWLTQPTSGGPSFFILA